MNPSSSKLRLWGLCAVLVCASMSMTSQADDTVFRLKNTLGFDRVNELVEVSLPSDVTADGKTLKDATGTDVAYELTPNGTLMFRANVPQGSTSVYTLTDGTRISPEKRTYAAIKAPGSRDDIAWENDLAAYRMYSSTLLKSEPNTGNGVDLWQKKMAEPVIDNMYAQSNYHSENPYGVDGYSVNGCRLGAGGVSHVVDGKIVTHNPFDRCEIIENGLQRSSFKLTFNNVDVEGASYTKTVTIETRAGSLLNKATVRYDGPAKPIKVGVALYLHTDMSGDHRTVTYTDVPGLIGLAEQNTEGTITSAGARFYLGAYMPNVATETAVLNDHLVVMTDYMPGTELTYYFGGGWNVFPADAYPSDDDWFDALNRFRKAVDSPIVETSASIVPNREDVITLLHNVNRHWIDTHPNMDSHFWDKAVYHTGNMAAYFATGEDDYRAYSEAWAIHNNWMGAPGTNKANWKYSYGEGGDYVLFGDNQICFQIYCDLYNLDPADYKIARAIEVMEYQMSTENVDYWWWVDGLYMVMPVMTKLYNITGNQMYLDKMYEYWKYATDLMYDTDEHIYYRDGGYVFPGWSIKVGDDPTPRKDFWARGAGWIFAAFARVLDELPATDAHRDEYIKIYKEMAAALKKAQQPEGHWTRSVLEPDYATGYETSGTALFTFGYLWGINNGIFSDKEYGEVVERAWRYLTEIAVQDNYDVGYVQPIGSKAEPGVIISAGQTANFGTGAFLLAASEMIKYAAGDADVTALRLSTVRLDGSNRIVAVFNEAPAEPECLNPNNYILNGKVIEAQIASDGDRTVTFEFDRPLDYGRYLFEVKGLTSVNGGALADNQSRALVRTVPLSACPEYVTVTAIGNQAGNTPQNTIDNSMGTRWSQAGLNQWICYNLAAVHKVTAVDVAFYAGAQRKSYFNVETSEDGQNFTLVLEGCESSGLTDELERYVFHEAVKAQYVRLMCNGNSQGGDNWNSITEARIVVDYEDASLGDIEGVPTEVYCDFFLPTATTAGIPLTWVSSNPDVISDNGLVCPPQEETTVVLTAYFADQSKDIEVKAMPRNVEKALRLFYAFEEGDAYQANDATMVRDRSGNARDAQIFGSAKVNGVLDLRDNTATGFATNGYAVVPEGVLSDLRSYTFMFEMAPSVLDKQPRAYDFGSASSNSVFLRLKGAAAGFKYNGGATILISTDIPFSTGLDQKVAVTFDARTLTTTIYLDGKQIGQSKSIQYEPYQLAKVAADTRNYIGRTQWWDTNVKNDNQDYQGTIDNFRLYGIALTADEIVAIGQEDSGIADVNANVCMLDRNVINVGETVVIASESEVSVYTLNGMLVATLKPVDGTCRFKGDACGVYVVRASQGSAKLIVK